MRTYYRNNQLLSFYETNMLIKLIVVFAYAAASSNHRSLSFNCIAVSRLFQLGVVFLLRREREVAENEWNYSRMTL